MNKKFLFLWSLALILLTLSVLFTTNVNAEDAHGKSLQKSKAIPVHKTEMLTNGVDEELASIVKFSIV